MGCALCESEGESVLWRDDFCRVVRASTPDYPGFLRVVLNRHAREMTDLEPPERVRLMRAVFACERALRTLWRPDKVNVASLGNQVPHVHWHVIARYRDDAHFPNPIWGTALRAGAPRDAVTDEALRAALAGFLGANP